MTKADSFDASPSTGSQSTKSKEQIKAERKAKAEAAKAAKLKKAQQKKDEQSSVPSGVEKKKQSGQCTAAHDAPTQPAATASTTLPPPPPSKTTTTGGTAIGAAAAPPASADESHSRGAAAAASAGMCAKSRSRQSSGGVSVSHTGAVPSSPAAAAAETATTGAAATAAHSGKSKAQLKAQRRALQEAQRAAKAAAAAGSGKKAGGNKSGAERSAASRAGGVAGGVKQDASRSEQKKGAKVDATAQRTDGVGRKSASVSGSSSKSRASRVERVLSTLPRVDPTLSNTFHFTSSVHAAVVRLAVRESLWHVRGATAASVALLAALARLVADYVTPPLHALRRHLPDTIGAAVQYLAQCRPAAPATVTVAKRLERVIHADIDDTMPDHQAKQHILQWIDAFIENNICKAMSAIVKFATDKVSDGDVIMTFGMSALVLDVLLAARQHGCHFSVIVLDNCEQPSGRRLVRPLVAAGVNCTYSHLAAVSLHVHQCTKVMIGAEAMLADGGALCAAGTSLMCLTAHSLNRPVIVCCETFKFCDRVFTDSLQFNQIVEIPVQQSRDIAGEGQPTSRDSASTDNQPVMLAPVYDVTWPDVIDVVITELGAIPCTSVPAVLRLNTQSCCY